ncbi:putative disease resistance protein At4g19050 [Rhodamnia argentea]|uniref:Disease resistance protein At4g19050 n=1 Tax=Rhodamnia argentea TaxID=178133 RepID=A0A8B8PHR8_9MYRT|nr:putative disease resistance protein At4g19050 [Rhodamnia argentea]
MDPAMSLTKVEKTKGEILKLLEDKSVVIVVIRGLAGVGKTWMAREMSKCVLEKSLSCCSIWVSCTSKRDIKCIYADIGHQLSLIPPCEKGDGSKEGTDKTTKSSVDLKDEVLKLIAKKTLSDGQGEKFFFIILDDVPTEMKEADITAELLVPHGQKVKILITRRDYSGSDSIEEAARTVKIEPFPPEDLSTILHKLVDKEIREFPNFKTLSIAIAEKCRGLPATIVMIAAAFNSIARNKSSCCNLESVMEEVANSEGLPEDLTKILHCCHDMLPSTEMANCFRYIRQFLPRHGGIHYNELIANWILEGYFSDADHVENAYAKGHCVLMELLDRRLLKIMPNNIVSIEGLALKIPDHRYGGYGGTSSLGLACAFDEGEWEGFGRVTWTDGMIQKLCWSKDQTITTLLLDGSHPIREVPETFFEPMKDLKILALFKPRFKSLPSPLLKMEELLVLAVRGSDQLENINGVDKLKALLILEISGASSLNMIPDDIFEHAVHLRTLNLSSLPITKLPSSFPKLSGLRWLILRDCPCLETLPSLTTLGNLEMIDASRTNLNKIFDKCFAPLEKLQYLNLSQTKIVRLPLICDAARLTWLILSGCSCLFRLPSLPRSLEILDLSDSATTEIEPGLRATQKQSNPGVTNLRRLNLSRCGGLEKLPPTKAFEKLELLDVSNAVNLKEIEDESFNHLKHLTVLNLSGTKIDTLPPLHELGNLRQLLLKDCKSLKRLPIMEGLLRLKELDLSGASSLEEMGPHSPDCEKFNLPNLQKLLLAGCGHLKKLPLLNTLGKLEILNLSGCALLDKIPDEFFEHLPCLHQLNLSETKIQRLPSIAKLGNLRHLILRDCHLRTTLAGLESLTNLQELDLSGTSSLGEVKAKCLERMDQLQILKLSGTKVDELSSISNLTNLTQLSLSGCSGFSELPHLGQLTKLEDLDLAETEIKSLPSIETLCNLRQLSLRNCMSLELEKLPPLKPQSPVEVLDLWGIRINEFPYWIFKMTNLKCLDLPDLRVIGQVDWGKIRCLPEKVNWEECGIFELVGTVTTSNRPFISVRGTHFFQLLERNSTLRNTCFKRFHFSVYPPPREQGEGGDIYHYRNDTIFREVYNKIRHLPDPGQPDQDPDPEQPDWVPDPGQPDQLPCPGQLDWSVEFHSFKSLGEYPTEVIKRSNCISFIDDSCMRHLSDLGDDYLKALKDCWLERCHGMECIFAGSDVTTLWVSNLPELRSIYSETVQSKSHKNLKNLYIDCCPMLVGTFSSGQLPENLEVIQIKFCDKLKTLIEHETSVESTLPKLKTLHLLGLPMLKSIGLQLLESLEIVQIQDCDGVETLFDHEALTVCTLPKLHTLHLSELRLLKSVGVSSASLGTRGVLKCPNLKNLYLDFCPMIVSVFSSGHPPKNLEVVQIQHCDKLKSLFEDTSSAEHLLPKLHTLRLLELPRLESIGISRDGSSLEPDIRGCQNLSKGIQIRQHEGALK